MPEMNVCTKCKAVGCKGKLCRDCREPNCDFLDATIIGKNNATYNDTTWTCNNCKARDRVRN